MAKILSPFVLLAVVIGACGSLDSDRPENSFGDAAGRSCVSDRDCPSGFQCKAVAVGELNTLRCVPPQDAGATASLDSGSTKAKDGDVDTGPIEVGCRPIFGPEKPSAPGGVRVVDSMGRTYFVTGSALWRAPAGGGVIQLLVEAQPLGYGFLGAPFVNDDDNVFFTKRDAIMKLNSNTGSITTFAPFHTNGYLSGALGDASGRLLGLGGNGNPMSLVNLATGAPLGAILPGYYALIRNQFIYSPGASGIERRCADGDVSQQPVVHALVRDAYGMAWGTAGKMYVGQGNTRPASLFEVPSGGGVPRVVTTFTAPIRFVATDSMGLVYVAGDSSADDGDTLWRVNPQTGAKTVYGCDPKAPLYPCGRTL